MIRFPRPSRTSLVLAFALAAAGSSSLTFAQTCADRFLPGPDFPAKAPCDGVIFGSTLWDPDGPSGSQHPRLVVSGAFNQIGGVTAHNVAMFDGANWLPMGAGLPNLTIDVVSFNNELYITTTSATSTSGVSKWVPATNSWVPVGGTFNAFVRDLEVHQNQLFCAGDFTSVSGTTINHVARLSGGAWQALPGGGVNGQVVSIHSLGQFLYVGGAFTTAAFGGGAPFTVRNLAKWSSTTTWQDCLQGVNGTVEALADDGSRLIVGGSFSAVHGTTVAAHNLGLFVPGTPGIWISGVNFPGNSVNAILGADEFNILPAEVFISTTGGGGSVCYKMSSGGSFTSQSAGVPAGGSGNTLARLPYGSGVGSDIVMGGAFSLTTGPSPGVANIARLHNSTWQPLEGVVNGPIKAFTGYNGSILGAGSMEQTTPSFETLSGIITWNPDSNAIGSYGTLDGTVNSMFVSSNGLTLATLYAAGRFDRAGFASGVNNIASWSGLIGPGGVNANWSPVAGGFVGAGGSSSAASINTLAGFGTQGGGVLRTPILHAGGSFVTAGGSSCRNIARLVGGAWQPLGSGLASSSGAESANCAANFSGQLIVGGLFDTAGGVTANSIAAWNATSWSALGSGVTSGAAKGTVNALAVFENQLYAGGSFDHAGGVACRNLAVWNGAAWADASIGILNANETVSALQVHAGQLFASTNQPSGNGGQSRIYRRSGTSWVQLPNALGIGQGPINALYSFTDRLHIGGGFGAFAAPGVGSDSPTWVTLTCLCPADFNHDGNVDPDDLGDFITCFFAQPPCPGTDFNADGAVDPDDLGDFITAFFTTPC